MRSVLDVVKTVLVYFVLCIAIFLMAKMVVLYASFDQHVGFLQVKQQYLPITSWKIAFYIHVFSSIFCLAAGLTQFSTYLQANHRAVHKTIGKFYVVNILFINFPAALIMAYYANGFLPSKIAFFILDILWFWFTLNAFLDIKKGDIQGHKNYMIRSYALTFSAITLRTWKIILSNTTDLDPISLYMIDAWLGFVPNLLVAEYLIKRKKTTMING